MSEKSILDLAAEHTRTVLEAQAGAEKPVVGTGNWAKKVVCDSYAVHPDQVEEAREMNRTLGTPCEVLPNGQLVFDNSQQIRKWAKARGLRHYGY